MQEKANKKKTRSQAQQQEEELIKKEKKTKKKHEQVGVSNPLEIQSDVAPCGAYITCTQHKVHTYSTSSEIFVSLVCFEILTI